MIPAALIAANPNAWNVLASTPSGSLVANSSAIDLLNAKKAALVPSGSLPDDSTIVVVFPVPAPALINTWFSVFSMPLNISFCSVVIPFLFLYCYYL